MLFTKKNGILLKQFKASRQICSARQLIMGDDLVHHLIQAVSTKNNRFLVLATGLSNRHLLNFHISETMC